MFTGPHSITQFDVAPDEAARFWSLVDRASAGCWLWDGRRDSHGYGAFSLFRVRRGQLKAHRVAYTITNGPIPAGSIVMHSCDNPPCVNPAHLRLGNASENGLDCARKGRNRNKRKFDWETLHVAPPQSLRDLALLVGHRDAAVFASVFGLYGFPRRDLREVASEIDYTREGVRQIVIRVQKNLLQGYAMNQSQLQAA